MNHMNTKQKFLGLAIKTRFMLKKKGTLQRHASCVHGKHNKHDTHWCLKRNQKNYTKLFMFPVINDSASRWKDTKNFLLSSAKTFFESLNLKVSQLHFLYVRFYNNSFLTTSDSIYICLPASNGLPYIFNHVNNSFQQNH